MIQGCVNARVTALYNNKQALARFTEKLTQAQRDLARDHLKTVLRIKKRVEDHKKRKR